MVTDDDIEKVILDLLVSRASGATICLSAVARNLSDDWRQLMEPVRQSACALVRGSVEITQRGEPVDPDNFKGPIRIRLKANS